MRLSVDRDWSFLAPKNDVTAVSIINVQYRYRAAVVVKVESRLQYDVQYCTGKGGNVTTSTDVGFAFDVQQSVDACDAANNGYSLSFVALLSRYQYE